jgi:hypothetical protein
VRISLSHIRLSSNVEIQKWKHSPKSFLTQESNRRRSKTSIVGLERNRSNIWFAFSIPTW